MAEGPYSGGFSDSALRELFGGMDACQQAVGAEHVSDIGVYYDPFHQVGLQQADFAAALTDDYWCRLRLIGNAPGRF